MIGDFVQAVASGETWPDRFLCLSALASCFMLGSLLFG